MQRIARRRHDPPHPGPRPGTDLEQRHEDAVAVAQTGSAAQGEVLNAPALITIRAQERS